MEDFIKQFHFENKDYFFLFSEMFFSKGRKFFVTTENDGVHVYFEIACDGTKKCRILGAVPFWIRQMEGQIIDALASHINNSKQ